MRTGPKSIRFAWTAFAALLLAVRLLMPAGFMPSFEHGAVTIVACPDAGPAATPMEAHHGGHSKKLHQPCPYASASGLGALAGGLTPLVTAMLAIALLLGRTFEFIERHEAHARPPLRGPPLTA